MKTQHGISITKAMLTSRQRGVSLVEIMVALVLSVILLGGVISVYLGSKQTYRVQDGQSRLQENARYALETLAHDIRLAGYMGCQSSGSIKPVVIANVPLLAPYTATALPLNVIPGPFVSGGDNASGSTPTLAHPSPALYRSLSTNVVRGTDAITLQFAEVCGGIIPAVTPPTVAALSTVDVATAHLNSSNTCGAVATNPTLIVSDCQTAHIFRAATDDANNTPTGNAITSLGKTYDSTTRSEIMRFRSYTYYIRCNNAGNCVSPSEPALYRYDNNRNSSDEIVEGIENMQILYGVDIDNDGTANEYLSANNIHVISNPKNPPDWTQLVSVRINITVRSVGESTDRLTSQPNPSRSFNGSNIVDNRLVRTFSSTIKLRNYK